MKNNEIDRDGYYVVVPSTQIASRSTSPFGTGSLMNPSGLIPAVVKSGSVYYSNGQPSLLSSLTGSEFLTLSNHSQPHNLWHSI